MLTPLASWGVIALLVIGSVQMARACAYLIERNKK